MINRVKKCYSTISARRERTSNISLLDLNVKALKMGDRVRKCYRHQFSFVTGLFLLLPSLIGAPTLDLPTLWPVPEFAIRLPITQTGTASYYHHGLAGRLQANGTPYDPGKMTAASLSLPLGARIEACRGDRMWRCVQVVIADRGPFCEGRILDLSRAAARRLGMLAEGVVPIRIEVL